MSEVEVNIETFRCAFPEFSIANYPDNVICRFLTIAKAYCSTTNFRIKPAVRILLIELMCAHLITLSEIDPVTHTVKTAGNSAGFETSASVGGVSVSLQAPITKNAYEQWINSTGYGQQYWALLTANVPTPIHYVGHPIWGIK